MHMTVSFNVYHNVCCRYGGDSDDVIVLLDSEASVAISDSDSVVIINTDSKRMLIEDRLHNSCLSSLSECNVKT